MNIRKRVLVAVALAWIFGIAVAVAQEPPEVEPGPAAWNCQRILDAGFIPHDYVYFVEYIEDGTAVTDPGIDYFHHTNTWNLGTSSEWETLVLSSKPAGSSIVIDPNPPHRITGFTEVLREYAAIWKGAGQPWERGTQLGVLRAADGSALDQGGIVSGADNKGEDGYRFTRADGTIVYYYDRGPSSGASFTIDTGWEHNPDYEGPQDARMSRIWRSAPECADRGEG